jgi:hypothetical protein
MAAGLASHEAPDDLDDAREALDYWERRERSLPRHRVAARREARAMARRWAGRVAAAERAQYGRGLLGALLLVTFEGRLPQTTRQTGRRLARRTGQVALLLVVLVAALALTVVVAAAELVASLV